MASHDTALPLGNQLSAQETQQMLTQVSQVLLGALELGAPPLETDTTGGPPLGKRTRGRPQRLVWSHLWASLLLCALSGMRSFAQWRRFLGSHPIAGWAPVWLCRNALVKRLMQAGLAPFEQLWGLINDQLDCQPATSSSQEAELAPFASRILCLDETKLDRIARRLRFLRELPAGEAGLFAGKVLALFDVRAQRWFRLEWRENVLDNSLVDLLPFLQGLQQGCLLLFDLGYFSFIFFDTLTNWGQWWISRYREGTVYQIAHTFYRHNDVLDALVWLGSSQHQCAHLVRLVRFGDGKQIRMYLTNVTDPHTLPLLAIPQLYARRWDIELAFRLLKEYLGLSHWWSCKPELVKVQIWVVLILSQIVMALRLHLAQAIRCDPFDLSLPLLLEHLPSCSGKPASLLDQLQAQGRQLGILRPQTHLSLALHLPVVPIAQYLAAPSDLPRHRPPRYRPYVPRKHAPSPSGYKNRSEKDRSIRELKAERRAQARQQKQAQNAP